MRCPEPNIVARLKSKYFPQNICPLNSLGWLRHCFGYHLLYILENSISCKIFYNLQIINSIPLGLAFKVQLFTDVDLCGLSYRYTVKTRAEKSATENRELLLNKWSKRLNLLAEHLQTFYVLLIHHPSGLFCINLF